MSDPAGARSAASRIFYTWTAQAEAAPLTITGGSGARFTTEDGAWWIDFGSMVWNAHLGHGHPVMKRALAEAAARGLVTMPSAVYPDKLRAAELLLEVAPRGLQDGRVFICLSGAEANENAVKMARLVTGRQKVVHRTRSYHGATLGMLSFSGDPRRLPFEPGLPGAVPWEDPYSALPHPTDLEALLQAERPETVAAVMLEGVVGANGVFVPPPGYFKRVREICDRHGVLFIADEVLSGFGRTGRWFAVDHDGVAPDLLTAAKGLTAGYAPGGAVVASARVARYFDDHVLSCGLTAYAHPLTCAAMAAAITVYRDDRLIERAARLGEWLQGQLATFARQRPYIREVRGLGLLWALDLAEPAPAATATAASAERMKRLKEALTRQRLHLHKRDNLVFVAPPLVSSEGDLGDGLAALGRALDEVFH